MFHDEKKKEENPCVATVVVPFQLFWGVGGGRIRGRHKGVVTASSGVCKSATLP